MRSRISRAGARAPAIATLAALCIVGLVLAACGYDTRSTRNGSSSSYSAKSAAPPSAKPTAIAAFEGFDLPLQTGTYWEFGWDEASSAFQAGGGVSRSSSHDRGTFRVVLGEPRLVEGLRLFAIRVEKTGGDDARVTTAWKFLGSDGNRLLGSLDGTSLRTVLDAQRGTQAGGGFFGSPWPTNRLLTVVRANIDNAFVKGEALRLSTSSQSGGCESFPGVGTICSDRSESSDNREFFRAGVGPLGYYGFSSVSSGSGGASIRLDARKGLEVDGHLDVRGICR